MWIDQRPRSLRRSADVTRSSPRAFRSIEGLAVEHRATHDQEPDNPRDHRSRRRGDSRGHHGGRRPEAALGRSSVDRGRQRRQRAGGRYLRSARAGGAGGAGDARAAGEARAAGQPRRRARHGPLRAHARPQPSPGPARARRPPPQGGRRVRRAADRARAHRHDDHPPRRSPHEPPGPSRPRDLLREHHRLSHPGRLPQGRPDRARRPRPEGGTPAARDRPAAQRQRRPRRRLRRGRQGHHRLRRRAARVHADPHPPSALLADGGGQRGGHRLASRAEAARSPRRNRGRRP